MKYLFIILFLITGLIAYSQTPGFFTGRQFFGISANNSDSVSAWYEDVFGLTLNKEIKTPQGIHVRIIGNKFLQVEIIQPAASKSLADCNLKPEEAFMLRGFFKTGFFVNDVDKAEQYFRSKKVTIKHSTFTDVETGMKSFIMQDREGNMLQVMQQISK